MIKEENIKILQYWDCHIFICHKLFRVPGIVLSSEDSLGTFMTARMLWDESFGFKLGLLFIT